MTPTRKELLAGWLPQQTWFEGDPTDLTVVGGFKFADPDDEAGIDVQLVRSAGATYHIPVTWRREELPEAAHHLIGETDHCDSGHRWCYDATGDPVYVAELFRVIHEGDCQTETACGDKKMRVEGSGIIPVSNAASESMRIVRKLDGSQDPKPPVLGLLTGWWTEADTEREEVLAYIR